jgi:hypothetical protein
MIFIIIKWAGRMNYEDIHRSKQKGYEELNNKPVQHFFLKHQCPLLNFVGLQNIYLNDGAIPSMKCKKVCWLRK